MRDLEKTIELDGSTYRIRKMVAMDGAFLLKMVTSKLIPLLTHAQTLFDGLADQASEKTMDEQEINGIAQAIQLIPTILDKIEQEDLNKLMQLTLNNVDKQLPAGWHPIMVGKNYGIEDAKYDTMLCLSLTVQSIMFNMNDFFDENGLTSVKSMIGRLFPSKQ